MEQYKNQILIGGGIFIALFIVGAFFFYGTIIPSNEKKLNEPVKTAEFEVSESTVEAIRSNFIQGCLSEQGSQQYCGCVAAHLVSDMDNERVAQIVSVGNSGDEAKMNEFMAPFTANCVYQ